VDNPQLHLDVLATEVFTKSNKLKSGDDVHVTPPAKSF